jgi:peptidylprolyl isomerase domain and WD repeat-containing protein 1
VNLVTNRVVRILGKVENTERFLRVALYQSGGRAATKGKLAGTSGRKGQLEPTVMTCAYRRQRLYIFTRREPPEQEDALAGR